MKVKRKVIEIDKELCDGCGLCVPACAEGAIQIIDGKAELVSEKYCDGLGACIGECPNGAIKVVEKEAEDFDPEAVMEYLKQKGKDIITVQPNNWPVQIRLVPSNAPFLRDAELVIAADCVSLVYDDLKNSIVRDRAVLMGCPKFDEPDAYVDKFAEIFKNNNINRITCVIMEVPCCSGLPMIIKKAMDIAGVQIPVEEKVVHIRF
ncbi:MAG: 4Fe-4S ferredoxin [Deltaproteobacteria bacterium]|nr:MAG: 4Fe-4S ferredoxin [Deltaproteobacteria bacterium]